jgi:hypothetical protein
MCENIKLPCNTEKTNLFSSLTTDSVTVLKPLLKAEAAQQIKDKPSPCSDAKN